MRKLREEKRKEFEVYLKQKDEEYAKQKNERRQILREDSEDEDVTFVEEWVEELEDYQEIILENE